jgi:plastocyanin
MFRRSRTSAVIAAAVMAAAAVAACSSAPSSTPSSAPPTVNFGANGGTSVGMAPMQGMAPMSPAAPEATAGAPADAPAAPVSVTAVNINNFAFVPATLTVHRGDSVTWANHDEEPHTIAAANGSFHSPGMDANATYSYTFNNPGNYDYICGIHPFMHGTVVVTP